MIIADRLLHFREGEKNVKVPVRIFAEVDGTAWSCRYEIDWPGNTRRSRAVGFDSMQAITLALQAIGAEIYTSDFHKSGSLSWDNSGKSNARKGYGFPVMPNLRDLLIGDDAKYL
jgi:hypothetical protein